MISANLPSIATDLRQSPLGRYRSPPISPRSLPISAYDLPRSRPISGGRHRPTLRHGRRAASEIEGRFGEIGGDRGRRKASEDGRAGIIIVVVFVSQCSHTGARGGVGGGFGVVGVVPEGERSPMISNDIH